MNLKSKTLICLLAFLPVLSIQPAPYDALSGEEAYIYTFRQLAVQEMWRSGIPASIILAQAILESEFGTSILALKSNNHFGIKCNDEWTKEVVYHLDDDQNEYGQTIHSCFRKYPSIYDSYIDHSNFLMNRKYYTHLFKLSKTDYKGWAKGLSEAGYATDPLYARGLIEIIEENKLYYYDFLFPHQVESFRH